MGFIARIIEKDIHAHLFQGKICIVYGPRQVGKTTLVKNILAKYQDIGMYLNCDEPDISRLLENKTSSELRMYFGNKKLLIFDEAQRIQNIGLILKLMIDSFPDIQIIATGSSSFDLANKINEPLTGRKYEYFLYPISFEELHAVYGRIELERMIETRMILGSYPDILGLAHGEARRALQSLSTSYLYKDLLNYGNIKKPEFLMKLLQALALQLGSEVSYNELSRLLGIDKKTVEYYIDLLEKAFVIFRLGSFSRNIRTELKKSKKIYFYDLGIRNALIQNFNPPHLRNDIGALFENLCIVERMKYNSYHFLSKNTFFWRTTMQKEIDYIEEYDGILHGFEYKYTSGKLKYPKEFLDTYKHATITLVTKDTLLDFVLDKKS